MESSWKATRSTRASITAGDKSGHESGLVRGECFLNVAVCEAQHTRRLRRNENLAFLLYILNMIYMGTSYIVMIGTFKTRK